MQTPSINILTRSGLVWLSPIILSVLLLTGCNQEQTKTKSPYPVIDSGVWSRPVIIKNNYWLDNNRVIFLSIRGQQDGNMKSRRGFDYALKIWTINNGVSTYRDASFFCYHDGIISYTRNDATGETLEHFHGAFGKEQLLEQDPNKKLRVNAMDCRLQDQHSIRYRETRHFKDMYGKDRISPKYGIRFLKSNHGYINKGLLATTNTGSYSAVLHKPDGSTVSLNIAVRDISSIRYYTFKDAYFIQKLQTDWRPEKNNRPETAWWLYPDGRVEEVKIPYGPWQRHTYFYPAKKGIVIAARGRGSRTRPGPAGAYLLKADGSHIKLLAGSLKGPRVSPDGCKLAAGHKYSSFKTKGDGPPRITLKVINLCPEVTPNGQ